MNCKYGVLNSFGLQQGRHQQFQQGMVTGKAIVTKKAIETKIIVGRLQPIFWTIDNRHPLLVARDDRQTSRR